MRSVLITGANGGLGKECARQLALQDGIKKVYLACRNEQRAKAAKLWLEASTGKAVFEIVPMDVSNLDSVRAAVASISEPIDCLVMNAGGMCGKNFGDKTIDGVIQIFAANVLGHVVLLDELLNTKKLTKVALYAGSEAARGIPHLGMKRPKLETSSADEFESICDGSFFGRKFSRMVAYGPIKYTAALWMSSVARKNPEIRAITMSPGGTGGTDIVSGLSSSLKFISARVCGRLTEMFGLMHALEVGARRYVDGLSDESYKSGVFYASKRRVLTGPVVDQGTIFEDMNIEEIQDNANEAIHRFIK